MPPTAMEPADALDATQARFVEDEGGYLYDPGFREVLSRLAKVAPDKLHQTEAVRAMVAAGKHLYQLLEEALVAVGVTHGQYRTLMSIRNHGAGGTHMHSIAGFLGVTPRNITGLVDGLESAGLVERVPDPDDRRATIVRMTIAGHAVAERGRRVHEAVLARVMGILTEEEKLQLRHVSLKLLRAVDEASAAQRRKANG